MAKRQNQDIDPAERGDVSGNPEANEERVRGTANDSPTEDVDGDSDVDEPDDLNEEDDDSEGSS